MAKVNIQQQVTDEIIIAMEKGVQGKWQKPWKSIAQGMPKNVETGNAYRGMNVILLGMTGYTSPVWGTYKQWKEKGCQVQEGEKGTMCVLWKPITKKDDNGNEKSFMFAKSFKVFNAEQVEGYEEETTDEPLPTVAERIETIEAMVKDSGAKVKHVKGDSAHYTPALDTITMPLIEQFDSTETYYGTLLHELVHWTGHKTRCDRDQSGRFGSADYAFEELIAEIGSSFICAFYGIEDTVREDHLQYIEHWLYNMRGDRKAIFSAVSKAQKAMDYLTGYVAEDVKQDDKAA